MAHELVLSSGLWPLYRSINRLLLGSLTEILFLISFASTRNRLCSDKPPPSERLLFAIRHAMENNKSQPKWGQTAKRDVVRGDTDSKERRRFTFANRWQLQCKSGQRWEKKMYQLIERNANYIFARRYYFPIILPTAQFAPSSHSTHPPEQTGSILGTTTPIEERSMELRENLRVETTTNDDSLAISRSSSVEYFAAAAAP